MKGFRALSFLNLSPTILMKLIIIFSIIIF